MGNLMSSSNMSPASQRAQRTDAVGRQRQDQGTRQPTGNRKKGGNTMVQRTSHQLSPLQQVRRSVRLTLTDWPAQLNDRDQAELAQILEGDYGYVDNPLFAGHHAEQEILDDAPHMDWPDTSWYHPAIDGPSDTARARGRRGSKAALLTTEQEQALFLQFNYCRYRVARLARTAESGAVQSDTAKDLLSWLRRAESYRDQIARTNLALVLAMAKRTRMSEIDFADLVSEGNMALLRAIDKFDVSRGFKFSTYACRAILKAFSRAGVKLSRYRGMFPTDFDPRLEQSDYSERKRQETEADCADEITHILRDNSADLTDIEQEVIHHRFAVDTETATDDEKPRPLTLEQVGRIIGVTKERVRQIQNKALAKIRATLEESYLS